MGISIGELKPSMCIIFNNELYIIVVCEHVKLGRGAAFCRAKVRNLRTSQTIEYTLRDSDKVEMAFIEPRKLQYLYNDGNIYHFIDMETYEEFALNKSRIEEKVIWLKENLELTGLFYNDEFIDLEIPQTIILTVVQTDPGIRGDTVKTGTKPATLETGLVIQVPLFINSDDVIKVDTRTKDYLCRV